MSRLKKIAFAGSFAFVFAAQAQAADFPSMPVPMFQPAPVVEEFASGWYLRGDLGYRANTGGDLTAAGLSSSVSFDDGFMIGAGAGYKWNWLRADVTFDYGLKSRYSSTTAFGPTDAKVDSFTTLLNVYADLGTWYGITPYVGAGVGAAYLTTGSISAPAAVYTPGASDGNKWNLAWAAMAGVSYSITPAWMFDIGYRYVSFGDAASASDTLGRTITFKDLAAHEFRLGARWFL